MFANVKEKLESDAFLQNVSSVLTNANVNSLGWALGAVRDKLGGVFYTEDKVPITLNKELREVAIRHGRKDSNIHVLQGNCQQLVTFYKDGTFYGKFDGPWGSASEPLDNIYEINKTLVSSKLVAIYEKYGITSVYTAQKPEDILVSGYFFTFEDLPQKDLLNLNREVCNILSEYDSSTLPVPRTFIEVGARVDLVGKLYLHYDRGHFYRYGDCYNYDYGICVKQRETEEYFKVLKEILEEYGVSRVYIAEQEKEEGVNRYFYTSFGFSEGMIEKIKKQLGESSHGVHDEWHARSYNMASEALDVYYDYRGFYPDKEV